MRAAERPTRAHVPRWLLPLLSSLLLLGCDGELDAPSAGAEDTQSSVYGDMATHAAGPSAPCPEEQPYASEVISFTPGLNAGYGEEGMPGVVLGPPSPGKPTSGSLDVVTLGLGGEIVLGFGDRRIVNGPGPDLVIWENPFWLGGDPETPFAELGEVALSEDGATWHPFPCEPELAEGYDPGCAGWRARGDFDPCALIPIDPTLTGGDPFDLESLGLEEARFIRIRDLSTEGPAPSAGFDLDAVGAVYLEPTD